MRILLTLAYEGTAYSGWQVQSNSEFTIQGAVQAALFTIEKRQVHVVASGRTDAGAHALAQKAHFTTDRDFSPRQWRLSLNALLPRDIRILDAQVVPDSFHAQRDVLRKTYFYQFWQHNDWIPPHLRHWAWSCGAMDMTAIREILPQFLGRHDFVSFQNSGTPIRNTEREIFTISLEELPSSPYLPPHSPMLRLTVTGNGFLKQMVRNMAGLIHMAGQNKLPEDLKENVFARPDRKSLPCSTAPAHGLFLANVQYPAHIMEAENGK